MHLKHNFKSESELKEKLDFIYSESSKGRSFHGIIEVAFHEVTIITAIHNIKSNKRSKTAINDQIRKLKVIADTKDQAIQVERINAMITGVTEYHKTVICSSAFSYMDHAIYKCADAVFHRKYSRNYKEYKVPLEILSNRPQRHKGYKSKTYAIKHEGMYIGITKAFLTHSQRETHCFDQNMTPYTKQGRDLYLKKHTHKRKLPMDRPPLYDINTLVHMEDKEKNNFEFYMNREYAYNRDKGKCKICGTTLHLANRHCHRVNGSLLLEKINKVSNLAWFCIDCDKYVHGNETPEGITCRNIKKIEKYRIKLI